MAILDDFEEHDNNNDYAAYLERYYGAAKAMASLFASASSSKSTEEIYPYEVMVFSDQPGVLRANK